MQHDEENSNLIRVTLRLPQEIYGKIAELAEEVQQPIAECLRALVIKGLAETALPTVAILRAEIQALAELIYMVREMNNSNPGLLERAKMHGTTIIQKLFKSSKDK
jgi:hypothetical protein